MCQSSSIRQLSWEGSLEIRVHRDDRPCSQLCVQGDKARQNNPRGNRESSRWLDIPKCNDYGRWVVQKVSLLCGESQWDPQKEWVSIIESLLFVHSRQKALDHNAWVSEFRKESRPQDLWIVRWSNLCWVNVDYLGPHQGSTETPLDEVRRIPSLLVPYRLRALQKDALPQGASLLETWSVHGVFPCLPDASAKLPLQREVREIRDRGEIVGQET